MFDSKRATDVIRDEKREILNLNPITFIPKTKKSMVQKLIIDIEQGRLHYNQHIADELSIFEYDTPQRGISHTVIRLADRITMMRL